MEVLYKYFLSRFKDPEHQATARLLVNFSLTEAFISSIYGVLHPWMGFHVPRTFFFGFSILIFLALLLFRTRLSLNVMANIAITIMWGGFSLGTAYSGGVFSLVLPWLALMPIMANLLVGINAARVWAVISTCTILFFFFYFKDIQPNANPGGDVRSLVAHSGLVAIAFLFSFLFYRAKDGLLKQVKEQNEYLLTNRKEIVSQNERLNQQKYEIQTQNEFIQRQNGLLVQQNALIDHVNNLLTKRVKEITDRTKLLERHWNTLLNISKSKAINFGDFDMAARHLTKVVAQSLNTERVSIWQYEADRRSIRCLILYDGLTDQHRLEENLLLDNFPRYFEALEKQEVIPADNAEENPKTFEFKHGYLRPRHIISMLDTPYFIDGKLAGVLCCESVDVQRHWSPEDVLFAQALSDVISLAYRAHQRREYELNIRKSHKEIERINQNLEQRVIERTQELENQNRQLAEYAFINSHLLRGPLSRLMGLINLIEILKLDEHEKDLLLHLKLSAQELDEVVKKISQAIAQNQSFDRNLVNPEEK
jgi:hypothetical protein